MFFLKVFVLFSFFFFLSFFFSAFLLQFPFQFLLILSSLLLEPLSLLFYSFFFLSFFIINKLVRGICVGQYLICQSSNRGMTWSDNMECWNTEWVSEKQSWLDIYGSNLISINLMVFHVLVRDVRFWQARFSLVILNQRGYKRGRVTVSGW